MSGEQPVDGVPGVVPGGDQQRQQAGTFLQTLEKVQLGWNQNALNQIKYRKKLSFDLTIKLRASR